MLPITPKGGREFRRHQSRANRELLADAAAPLNEGHTVEYELVTNRGKTSAENLKVS